MIDVAWQYCFIVGYMKKRASYAEYCTKKGLWFHIATGNEPNSTNPTLIKCCSTDAELNAKILQYGAPGAQLILVGKVRHLPLNVGRRKDIINYVDIKDINFLTTREHVGEFDLEHFLKIYGLEDMIRNSRKSKKDA